MMMKAAGWARFFRVPEEAMVPNMDDGLRYKPQQPLPAVKFRKPSSLPGMQALQAQADLRRGITQAIFEGASDRIWRRVYLECIRQQEARRWWGDVPTWVAGG